MSIARLSRQITIDAYDFDKTIYDGDCSLDFYTFCLRKYPATLRYVPAQMWHLCLFALKIEERTTFKAHFFSFLRGLDDVSDLVDLFWSGHHGKIKAWYGDADHSNDVIISASPEFLLLPVASTLKVARLIATRMDVKTGAIVGKNCRGEEKVSRLREAMGGVKVRRAYSDSLSDMPLLALAKEKYIIRGDKVLTLDAFLKRPVIENVFVPDPID